MVKKISLLLYGMLAAANLQCGQLETTNAQPNPEAAKYEEDYRYVQWQILERIEKLKEKFSSMQAMTNACYFEYNVTWKLEDPSKPHSKGNARLAIYGKDGYWFSLTFYRGKWEGAAFFLPIEFGDLKLWFDYGHSGNAEVIGAVTTILREENEAYCRKHPEQKLDEALHKTSQIVSPITITNSINLHKEH
jgi:hypothetical protein